MKIDTCLLCEAASVHEGLLFILGGGITGTTRDSYPSPLGMSLAMRIMVHPTEMAHPHKVEVFLNDEDGNQVTKFNVEVGVSEGTVEVPAGEEAEILFAWDFPGRPNLPHRGKYSFEILIDGNHLRSVPFNATQQGGE
jgi:hypothetical protein